MFSIRRYASIVISFLPASALALPSEDVAPKPASSSAGTTVTVVGAVGLGTTYLLTALAGATGPSTASPSYLIPVVGPFLQAGKVSSPYDTMNILSGCAQTAFLATLLTGLAIHSMGGGDNTAGALERPMLLPIVDLRNRAVGVSLGF